jgi:hypothetical protein
MRHEFVKVFTQSGIFSSSGLKCKLTVDEKNDLNTTEGKSDQELTWQHLSKIMDRVFFNIMLYRVHVAMNGLELTTFVVIGTDCVGSCKSNYHTITITTAPYLYEYLDQ